MYLWLEVAAPDMLACLLEFGSMKWWLLSGAKRRGSNQSVIVCHFTLLISVNNRPCVDVWKCAPPVSETSISLSNGAPVNEKCIGWFRCEGVKHKPSYLELFMVVSRWRKAVSVFIFHISNDPSQLCDRKTLERHSFLYNLGLIFLCSDISFG